MKHITYLVDYKFNVNKSFVKGCSAFLLSPIAKFFFWLKCYGGKCLEVNLYKETKTGPEKSKIETLRRYYNETHD